ncbi:MAG: hypothetical protein J7M26_04470, partial [Armatimonadetes bacterium]|nr:hypothetical protein [Armatimonadota bacterium]
MVSVFSILTVLVGALPLQAGGQGGWQVERVRPGVWMVYNDNGTWGGPSMGTSHQNNPRYQTRKTLNLAVLPEDLWAKVKSARLRVFFAVQDYSWALPEVPNNGMDESFEVVLNGHATRYPVAGGFGGRASAGEKMKWQWQDFPLPLDRLKRGDNEVIFRKVPPPGKTRTDDYIYVGIDNTAEHGTSAVSFDGGKTWSTDQLNTIGARGEYMVRVVLITGDLHTQA